MTLLTPHDLATGLRFLRTIRPFLRRPLSIGEARRLVRSRLAGREADFLRLMESAVYSNPGSPYLPLLGQAGFSREVLRRSVERTGLEPTLRLLFREGVFFSVDEFKGRAPVRRGNASFLTGPTAFHNPGSGRHLLAQTGGSTGRPLPVLIDLSYIRERAADHLLALDARGGLGWTHAIWGIPGNTDMVRVLELCALGSPPERWFSQVDPNSSRLHPRYRWSARVLRWAGRALGAAVPAPEYVPLDEPGPVVKWMRAALDSGRTPHLITWGGSAVRACLRAADSGVRLDGAQFSIGGEPVTEAKLRTIRSTGAAAVPRYLAMECGYIGYGCLKPSSPDDLHILSDLLAVFRAEEAGACPGSPLPPGALLLTSLRPAAPFILLNVSLGDEAQDVGGACGCRLESQGWTKRVRNVRSAEKLTAAGMTFLDADVVRILEETLPRLFGGTMLDYQLIEEEAPDGNSRLRLLLGPGAGPADERLVKDAFLEALGSGSEAERVMSLNLRAEGLLTVARESPRRTDTGKIIHLLRRAG